MAVAAINVSGILSPWLRRYWRKRETARSEICSFSLSTWNRCKKRSAFFSSVLLRQPMNNSICVIVLMASLDCCSISSRRSIASPICRAASIRMSVSTRVKALTIWAPIRGSANLAPRLCYLAYHLDLATSQQKAHRPTLFLRLFPSAIRLDSESLGKPRNPPLAFALPVAENQFQGRCLLLPFLPPNHVH